MRSPLESVSFKRLLCHELECIPVRLECRDAFISFELIDASRKRGKHAPRRAQTSKRSITAFMVAGRFNILVPACRPKIRFYRFIRFSCLSSIVLSLLLTQEAYRHG